MNKKYNLGSEIVRGWNKRGEGVGCVENLKKYNGGKLSIQKYLTNERVGGKNYVF